MKKYSLPYTINDISTHVIIDTEGVLKTSKTVLYNRDNCYLNVDWESEGYKVINLFNKDEFKLIYDCISNYVLSLINKIKYINKNSFSLEKYHTFVNDEEHLKVIKSISAGRLGVNGIPLSILPFSYKRFDSIISRICCKPHSTKKTFYGIFTSNNFWIRIVRPLKGDNNPPHRDCYFDRNKRLINIYAPIAGSNVHSSLPLISGSHFWNEDRLTISKGRTFVNNIKFTNPAIVDSLTPLNMITPDPKPGDCIVFTPYLIHGGGKNFNTDVTRVSLEMRFWPV